MARSPAFRQQALATFDRTESHRYKLLKKLGMICLNEGSRTLRNAPPFSEEVAGKVRVLTNSG